MNDRESNLTDGLIQGPRQKREATIQLESLAKDLLDHFDDMVCHYNILDELEISFSKESKFYNVNQILCYEPDFEQLQFDSHDFTSYVNFVKNSNFEIENIRILSQLADAYKPGNESHQDLSLAEKYAITKYTSSYYSNIKDFLLTKGQDKYLHSVANNEINLGVNDNLPVNEKLKWSAAELILVICMSAHGLKSKTPSEEVLLLRRTVATPSDLKAQKGHRAVMNDIHASAYTQKPAKNTGFTSTTTEHANVQVSGGSQEKILTFLSNAMGKNVTALSVHNKEKEFLYGPGTSFVFNGDDRGVAVRSLDNQPEQDYDKDIRVTHSALVKSLTIIQKPLLYQGNIVDHLKNIINLIKNSQELGAVSDYLKSLGDDYHRQFLTLLSEQHIKNRVKTGTEFSTLLNDMPDDLSRKALANKLPPDAMLTFITNTKDLEAICQTMNKPELNIKLPINSGFLSELTRDAGDLIHIASFAKDYPHIKKVLDELILDQRYLSGIVNNSDAMSALLSQPAVDVKQCLKTLNEKNIEFCKASYNYLELCALKYCDSDDIKRIVQSVGKEKISAFFKEKIPGELFSKATDNPIGNKDYEKFRENTKTLLNEIILLLEPDGKKTLLNCLLHNSSSKVAMLNSQYESLDRLGIKVELQDYIDAKPEGDITEMHCDFLDIQRAVLNLKLKNTEKEIAIKNLLTAHFLPVILANFREDQSKGNNFLNSVTENFSPQYCPILIALLPEEIRNNIKQENVVEVIQKRVDNTSPDGLPKDLPSSPRMGH